MNDDLTYWLVEQYVELGNESFWHEKARLLQRKGNYPESTDTMLTKAELVAVRDVRDYGGRYRIRVIVEKTVYDSGERVARVTTYDTAHDSGAQ